MQPLRFAIPFAVVAVCAFSTTTVADNFQLNSLDWPPYTGAKLAEQGSSAKAVKEIYASAGHNVSIKILPWQRAVDTAKSDPNIVGYFPEYHDTSLDCVFSDPIGTGPLGFAQNSSKPIAWQSLDDLKGLRIGVVAGYVNTTEFDQRVSTGQLSADATQSDEQNLIKLANGRLDLAVIDRNVMAYLIDNSPKLASLKDKLQFNDTLLEDKTLHICFTQDASGQAAAELFKQAQSN
ncbi:substrate-binding periplasmic protein [Atopomonas sediminilitoris]|uniref:substrate-binding periplasmic protein n=1 Tax=Atopomonas sediminilitoris TaxID=2919919 RepID=UPI001F4DCDF8|nr:transporter substrate-binding domain-containing protein [Atopomonas sediminilitoris]MCJ8170521.1 transporter substrate-binding domain-containing protein [Atopomonas sediminilitoris]